MTKQQEIKPPSERQVANRRLFAELVSEEMKKPVDERDFWFFRHFVDK